MDFGKALNALKSGERVSRTGWNGKRMFAYLVPSALYPVQTGAAKAHFGEGSMVPYRAYLALKTVDEDVAVWVPSVSDLLAYDWQIVCREAESASADLPPHMQRVAVERDELADRLTKLQSFIGGDVFNGLPPEQQADLVDQQAHMCAYLARLEIRLAR